MIRKTLAVIAIASGLLASTVPAADASLWTGACTVTVTFSFNTPVKATLTAPNHSVGATGTTCAVSSVPSPLQSTAASGTGASILWTCEATAAEGFWDQSWSSNPPPAVSGNYVITGTWGAWTLVAEGPNFAAVAQLTVAPSDAGKLAQCAASGISSLTMTGVMYFLDP